MKALKHPLLLGALVSLTVAGAVAGHRLEAWHLTGLERLELLSLDLRFRLRGERPVGPEVAIVVFDDESYRLAPQLWEQRAGWARVVRSAKEAGARTLVLDALFTQPEQILPESLRAEIDAYLAANPEPLHDDPADRLVREVHRELIGDELLAAAIEEAGNVILILHVGAIADGAPEATDRYLSRGRYGQSALGDFPPPASRGLLASMPVLNRHARGLGFATVFQDVTHSVRAVDSARIYGEGVYAPLGVHAVAHFQGVGRARLSWLGADREVRIGDISHPFDLRGRFLLNYRGSPGSFPIYSVFDLVEGRIPPGALDDRIVIVGPAHLGHDRVRTPFSQHGLGVEVHATIIDNLLRGDALVRLSWWVDALICLALGLLVSFCFWSRIIRSAPLQVSSAIAVAIFWLVLSGWMFTSRDLWAPWFGPGLVSLLVGALCLSSAYLGEGLQRRRLRKAFAHYLSDEVITELLSDPAALSLGGKRRELSVLFSDVRNFTSFSETLSPEQLIALLNTYLTPMTRAVLGAGGFLDKYIGDAVMAVFGAPVPREGHASMAIDCAIRMHRELDALRPRLAELGVDDLRIGVGVNTGPMVVGNMGAEERFDYTVAGDSVNLASRLEGLTKFYSVFCLVGETTRRAAGERFEYREIDLVQVKGKHEPVAIFELLGEQGSYRVAEYEEPELFARAISLWREGKMSEARESFAAFAEKNPSDAVSRLYLDRLEELRESAPEGWTGVFAHAVK